VHVVQTPFQAPDANAYAERVVRSITRERHFRRALHQAFTSIIFSFAFLLVS
jgi:hypothetical protein